MYKPWNNSSVVTPDQARYGSGITVFVSDPDPGKIETKQIN